MKTFFFAFLLFFAVNLNGQNSDCNCCDEAHEAFDFWLGNWEVFNAEGDLVGRNKIVKKEDGCLLQEEYHSTASEFTGQSFNFYNSTEDRWEQLWVDNQGTYLHLYGNIRDGAMVLEGDHGKGEEKRTDRIAWTLLEDGRVQQLWEMRKEGQEWNTVFEGYYSRVEE